MGAWFVLAVLAVSLAWPATSGAFSFGSFAAGEQVTQIQVSASSGGARGGAGDTILFDTATNTLSLNAVVSEIVTTEGTYSVGLGDVLFSASLTLSSETIIPGAFIAAEFVGDAVAADLSIIDLADGGNLLLTGDFLTPLSFLADANPLVLASFGSEFAPRLGEGDSVFETAVAGGLVLGSLNNFVSNGVPVSSDLCGLVAGNPLCDAGVPGGELDDFTANLTMTLDPPITVAPEPGSAALLALATGLLLRRRGAAGR